MPAAENQSRRVNFSDSNDEIVFNTSKAALTPALNRIAPEYRTPNERPTHCVAPPMSIVKPNYEDILRRVSIVIHQHIQKCELRLSMAKPEDGEVGLFRKSQIDKFSEAEYVSPQYVYHFVRAPIARMGFLYGIRKLEVKPNTPDLSDIYTFLCDIFVKAYLSAECSIVCLIYVERLMEVGRVPIISKTWKPCLICGMLLASKVWQDLSSWNSEISQIYPQFSVQAINKLESVFCKEISWDLYISSSTYAKYYFALRSLSEKKDFRRNYNSMLVNAPGAEQVAERSEEVKQKVFNTMTLSCSLPKDVTI